MYIVDVNICASIVAGEKIELQYITIYITIVLDKVHNGSYMSSKDVKNMTSFLKSAECLQR